jgi:hypothetical protein
VLATAVSQWRAFAVLVRHWEAFHALRKKFFLTFCMNPKSNRVGAFGWSIQLPTWMPSMLVQRLELA